MNSKLTVNEKFNRDSIIKEFADVHLVMMSKELNDVEFLKLLAETSYKLNSKAQLELKGLGY